MDPGNRDETSTSDYGESVDDSEFTSIINRNLNYSYHHGRRYQATLADRYGLPNDNTEQLREALKHKLYADYILEGKACVSPIGRSPHKIVDLGTGIGLWAQDVADRFPSARVIGTDISPIQAPWASPNLEFRVEDLEDENRPWTNIYAHADLVHIRGVLQTLKNPQRFLEKCFEVVKPGGWIECHEIYDHLFSNDDTVDTNHPYNILCRKVEPAFARLFGWHFQISREIPNRLRDIGFVNVQEQDHDIPIGRWHPDPRQREMGLFNQSIIDDFVPPLLARYEAMGMTLDEANQLGQDIYEAFDNPQIHGKLTYLAIWAQKPSD